MLSSVRGIFRYRDLNFINQAIRLVVAKALSKIKTTALSVVTLCAVLCLETTSPSSILSHEAMAASPPATRTLLESLNDTWSHGLGRPKTSPVVKNELLDSTQKLIKTPAQTIEHESDLLFKLVDDIDELKLTKEAPETGEHADLHSGEASTVLDTLASRIVKRLETPAPSPKPKSPVQRIKSFFKEMKTCQNSMSTAQTQALNRRYLIDQIAIAELVSVGTNLTVTYNKHKDEILEQIDSEASFPDQTWQAVTAGVKVIDFKHLSTDMAMAALWTTMGTGSIMKSPKFEVKWIKMVGWNQVKGAVDATLYLVNPVQGNSDESIFETARHRLEFSSMWGTANAITPVTLYTLLSGLECMYPGAVMKKISRGVRLSVQTGTSLLYFTLRNDYLEK
jgi:hypothetical protein